MNKQFFRWNVAQLIIAIGICLSVIGFTNHFANVVYAACGNTVRSNSPCRTQILACTPVNGKCPSIGEETQKGNFQCDMPKSYVTCTGTGNLAPCYNKFGCIKKTVGLGCEMDPDAEVEAGQQETLKETGCPG
ncbi:MAG: hypothetical protein LBQ50_14370 [Planctomycetaceae bacterium]|nr:hypothetical protein [Planctomycetaceae bacterium]